MNPRLNPRVTESIQNWLSTEPAARDLMAGAELLLSLNRNRALYNNIRRNPERMAGKLEYELKKHLRIRLDGMTQADVARMDREVMSAAAVIASDKEIAPAGKRYGRRDDHESLPAEVQKLWDDNSVRRRKIGLLFNELKAMNHLAPCDRYEKLKMLDEAESTYRRTMQAYDEWTPENDGRPLRGTPEFDRAVSAARKKLSKYKKILSEGPDTAARLTAADKIREAVSALQEYGAPVSAATVLELQRLGVIAGTDK